MTALHHSQNADDPVYMQRTARARADKAPSRGTPMGAVAAARVPGGGSRREMAREILAEDGELVAGPLGATYYRPVTVCGRELKLEPLQPSIGTAVHGLDLAADLDDPEHGAELVAFVRELWLQRRVLVFRGQEHLSREGMVAFARHFGELGAPFGERGHMPNSPHDPNPQIEVGGLHAMLVLTSDEATPSAASGWHADATWQPRPPMASILMCREAPPVGGDTCFCDCYGMWEGLPLATKKRVEHLTAVHVGNAAHQMDGRTPVAEHPVARTHPETGRTTLYVQQGFVRKFADRHEVPPEEARKLLLQMKMQEGRPEYTCRVRWAPGSIAIWDNRAVLHSASGDFWPHKRLMERLTILDFDESRRAPYYAPPTASAPPKAAFA